MHELSIAQSILESLEPYADKKILSIRIRVGALTAVMPDALTFSFEVIREGTAAESAKLVIEHVPVRCLCKECNKEFQADGFVMSCNTCGSSRIDVLSGNELDIVEVELEE